MTTPRPAVGIALVMWFIPPPAGVSVKAWHLLSGERLAVLVVLKCQPFLAFACFARPHHEGHGVVVVVVPASWCARVACLYLYCNCQPSSFL